MTASQIDQFNAGRNLAEFDMWFEGPEAREWLAANEVLMRRCFALMRPAGEDRGDNRSRSGDPQFDKVMGESKQEHYCRIDNNLKETMRDVEI